MRVFEDEQIIFIILLRAQQKKKICVFPKKQTNHYYYSCDARQKNKKIGVFSKVDKPFLLLLRVRLKKGNLRAFKKTNLCVFKNTQIILIIFVTHATKKRKICEFAIMQKQQKRKTCVFSKTNKSFFYYFRWTGNKNKKREICVFQKNKQINR
eukprot:GEMP01094851.1.p1 GENE.GEMP01094851.1~~GEMP01094851.1.p1  ORF type:complete len:153 (-),score=0.67 GEMP01094851.1:279-737(-)